MSNFLGRHTLRLTFEADGINRAALWRWSPTRETGIRNWTFTLSQTKN